MTSITLLRVLSLGYLRLHPTRSLLVALSIALGVATLVGTQALNKGLKAGVQEGVNPLAGLADLLVTNGQAGVDYQLAEKIRKAGIPGVKNAEPVILWRVSIPELENRVAWLFGIDVLSASQVAKSSPNPLGVEPQWDEKVIVREMKSLQVELAGKEFPLYASVISANLARDLGEREKFKIRNAFLAESLRVGTIDLSQSNLPLKESSVVVMPVLTASKICFPDSVGKVHQIAITITEGANPDVVEKALRAFVGDLAEVQSVDASKQMVAEVTAGLEIGLAIGGAGALVVGLFLVYNALSVSVAERRHDIGILRSVGATRLRIASLFVMEALIIGLIGSGVGLPLGWLLAWGAVKPMASMIGELLVPIDSARIYLPLWLAGVAVAAGTLVAVLAALVPALQAAGEDPADAVRRVPRRAGLWTWVAQVGGAALLLGVGLGTAAFRSSLPPRVGMFAGIVAILVGGLVATPLLASLVGRVLQPLFRYFLGLEGRLAADNLVRSPGRTGLVIAALAATGGLMVQTAGFLKSTREAIHEWIEEKVAADLFVTAGSSVTSGGAALPMQDAEVGEKLRQIPGVEVVLPVRFHRVEYTSPRDGSKRIVFLVGVDLKAFDNLTTERPLARAFAEEKRLREPGCVAVSQNFSALYRVKIGDTIRIPSATGKRDAEVVAIMPDYTWNQGTIIMDLQQFRREYKDNQVDVYDLFLEPWADPEQVRERIRKDYADKHALFVVSRDDVHAEVHGTLQRVYGMAYAQQTVVGLVALLGVVSALFISVLQRRRELGLLRAVGASRSMVLRSVLAEAVLMGMVGAVVGFGIGLLLEWYVLDVLLIDESGFEFPMRIPWREAGLVSLASVVLATLAGLWPASHATQLRIPEAIAYE